MPNETWAPIPRFHGRYEVSTFGSVRSTDWMVERPGQSPAQVRGRDLYPGLGDTGYIEVRLIDPERGSRIFKMHRLVLETFVGPCPDGHMACHNDGDRANNLLDNLRWDTASSNMIDKQIHGTDPYRNRQECPRGHALVEPNLDGHMLRKGWRSCKVCARARSWAHGRPERDFAARADHLYARMTGVSVAERQ